MRWFPSIKVKTTLVQRDSDWGLLPRFEPTAKVTKRPGKVTSFTGALTRLNSDGGQTVSDLAQAESRRAELKVAAKVEKWHAKAIEASGNRYEVKDRDGHPRGYFPTLPPAQVRADEVGGFVTDRLEGLIVYSAIGDTPDAIPDSGSAEPTAEEMDW